MIYNKSINLFCIPYAGGSSSIYYIWRNQIASFIKLLPLELPGRGQRFSDTFYAHLNDAVEDLIVQMKPYFHLPYALFGHSMGSMLVYHLVNRLIEEGYPCPIHIFVSGRYPPYIQRESKTLHLLEDQELIEETKKYGGLTEEVLSHKELLKLQIKILRNDYRLIEEAPFYPHVISHCIDLTALTGVDDDVVHPALVVAGVHVEGAVQGLHFPDAVFLYIGVFIYASFPTGPRHAGHFRPTFMSPGEH